MDINQVLNLEGIPAIIALFALCAMPTGILLGVVFSLGSMHQAAQRSFLAAGLGLVVMIMLFSLYGGSTPQ